MKIIKHLILGFALTAPCLAHAEMPDMGALLGTWSVDTARLPNPAHERPQEVTIAFMRQGMNAVTMRVDVLDAQGGRLHAQGTTTLDGKAGPVSGELEANSAAGMLAAPGVLVMQLARDGIPVSVRVYTATPDAQAMIETVAYVDPQGKPLVKTNHFKRVK